MRFKCKPDLEAGDIKVKTKFLWFPVCINKERRWLERATIKYEFEGWSYMPMDCWESVLWHPIEFID